MMLRTFNRWVTAALLVAAILLGCLLISPARAAIIGVAEGERDSVEFHNDRGECVAPALRAYYVTRGGERIPGCWKVISLQVIQIVFADGDFLQMPASAIKPPKDA